MNVIFDFFDIDKFVFVFDFDVFMVVVVFFEWYLYYCYSLVVLDESEKWMVLEEIDFCVLWWKLEGC